ncbi:hypothetical protein D9623_33485 (plasmid) [Azospirillum brasilense]|uniref:Uncharacterized protein n=1 Tax=Azospirillum brasilense TaxID=192 RepID=A0A4D8QPK9_AZOBR|nr:MULTISPECIES: hypothetical protein [Azospirillum]YP_001686903.1 hypothetical protein APCd_gp62 [Azospirillum phage Cd]MDW7555350.1 hypothetical protein [Azospirillum brasilense]MDW7595242.1 hypothetical protein [Azospirillum brasilense]MDW7630396.1 hypothetical protein [Azospirillum brasilense]MDX5949763.1 hypothetical protein [Azospirillum brasilense]OPH16890.1 hypothetical protein FE89_02735 [Azospirillum brasilense]
MADHLTEAAKRIAWAHHLTHNPASTTASNAAQYWQRRGDWERAAWLSAARAVLPEGSVVVPREPTDKMLLRGATAPYVGGDALRHMYRSMIAAATEDAP